MTEQSKEIQKTNDCGPKPLTRSEQLLCAIGGRVVLTVVLLLGAASIVLMAWVIYWAVQILWFGHWPAFMQSSS